METWATVVGRKEKAERNRERREMLNERSRKEIGKKKKPLKTSAVVITSNSKDISYAEVLA